MVTWNGEYFCDAGFLINLKDRVDRFSRAMENLSITKLSGIERFDAILIEDPGYTKYGCTQSHIEIAKLQIQNNWEYVLYLEDDIVSDFFYCLNTENDKINKEKVISEIIKDFNSFKPDVLWLGVRPEGDTTYVSNTLVRPTKTLMSHAYVGSLKFANFLVNNLNYRDNSHFSGTYPIDFFISQITSKDCWRIDAYDKENIIKNNDLSVMITSPMIFNQGESFSNLTDNLVDYKNWVRGCYNFWINPNKLGINPYLNE